MKKLHFKYDMAISYDYVVESCNFTIKCIPESNMRQKISDLKISLSPPVTYQTGRDGMGNCQIYGLNETPHDSFRFTIEGNALTRAQSYEVDSNEDLDMIFGHPHGLSMPGPKIRAYYQKLKAEGMTAVRPYSKAKEIMHRLHEDFVYAPGTTNVNTGAEEAFAQGCGVCQDYAHIFIALMHLAGIPARYVTGLLIGEGASHAWVEVLEGGKWHGLDPTNDMKVGEDHIRIGAGRDARDCMINRGIMHGGMGVQVQQILASVTEMEQ